jgi:hypothetical protein
VYLEVEVAMARRSGDVELSVGCDGNWISLGRKEEMESSQGPDLSDSEHGAAH